MDSVLKENRRGDRQLDSTVGGFSRKTGTGEACSAIGKKKTPWQRTAEPEAAEKLQPEEIPVG
jgi:hypothetical protein